MIADIARQKHAYQRTAAILSSARLYGASARLWRELVRRACGCLLVSHTASSRVFPSDFLGPTTIIVCIMRPAESPADAYRARHRRASPADAYRAKYRDAGSVQSALAGLRVDGVASASLSGLPDDLWRRICAFARPASAHELIVAAGSSMASNVAIRGGPCTKWGSEGAAYFRPL